MSTVEQYRKLDCETRQTLTEDSVVAANCGGRAMFIVPSHVFRRMAKKEVASEFMVDQNRHLKAEVIILRKTIGVMTRTSSISEQAHLTLSRDRERAWAQVARANEQISDLKRRRFYEHPIFTVAVSAAVSSAILAGFVLAFGK